jgi:predicted metal-dependent phosphoesterase TrpH
VVLVCPRQATIRRAGYRLRRQVVRSLDLSDETGAARVIKVDLHVHTSYSVDGSMSPEEVVEVALLKGVGALAITDHNTIAGALAVQRVAPFPVIIGQEISTCEGELLGLFLQEEVPRDLSAVETVGLIKEQGGLAGVPHPFDRLRGESLDRSVLQGMAGALDFVEVLNGRVTFGGDNRRAREFAWQRGLTATAGSDAHSKREVGQAYVEMDSLRGQGPFLEQLRHGRVMGSRSPFWVHFLSIYARARRTLDRG